MSKFKDSAEQAMFIQRNDAAFTHLLSQMPAEKQADSKNIIDDLYRDFKHIYIM